MKNSRIFGYGAAFVSALYALSACNEATILGKDLIPGADQVNVSDSTINSLITHNIYELDSSVRTGQGNYGITLGSITDDPIFGKAHGFGYTQVGLSSNEFTFQGTGYTLDSVVLYVGYTGSFYGDSVTPMNLKVYRMNEPDFKIDSNYIYDRPLSYDAGQQIGSVSVTPLQLRDSVSAYGVKSAPALRIPLTSAFGNLLLAQKSDEAFKNDSSFRAFLKGLAIVPDTLNGKNMAFLNLNSGTTRIAVYYKSSVGDSLTATFPFGQYSSAHANYFTRNLNGAQAAPYLNTNKPEGDSVLYLQEAPGIYTKIQLPGLENFPKSIINKAELVITEISSGMAGKDALYTEPERLFLWRFVTNDSLGYVIDYGNPNNPDFEYFGGNRTVISDIGGIQVVQYKFNIARHLQFVMDNKLENTPLKLEAVSSRANIDMRRVKAGGGNISRPANIKLRIIYTQL